MDENKRVKCVRLFAAVVSLSALANGLSASIYNNYFSDVYQITAFQRGLLETPRAASRDIPYAGTLLWQDGPQRG